MAVDFEFERGERLNGIKFQDVTVVKGDISLIDGVEEITQNVRIRLFFYKQEWYLDIDAGVPYFEVVFGKNNDVVDIDRVIKKAILETPEILRITEFASVYDSRSREYSCTFRADTVDGDIVGSSEEFTV